MKQAMLGLFTETSLHAGTGQMTGVIDLPIQREAHTDWPCVYGSAVKGAMRVLADSQEHDWVEEVFGPEDGNTHAGSIAISDARLLLLPVRSLTGHFKWVTCPALLKRLQRDYRRLGLDDSFLDKGLAPLDDTHAFVSNEKESHLFLEEFRFQAIPIYLQEIINNISQLSSNLDEISLKEQLVIVNNEIFSHLARFATPVNAHIAIDNTTKIVKPGALWYEETLPADTLLYTTIVAFHSRKEESEKEDCDILEHLLSLFPDERRPYLQIGGNETIGMGWCQVKSLQGGE